MTPLAAVALVGYATFYSPGVMERVAAYRGLEDRCPDCAGYAAMIEPDWLGRTVWIAPPGGRPEKFLVVDCGQDKHRAAQHRARLVAEVDALTARRWGMTGRITVRIMVVGPSSGAPP